MGEVIDLRSRMRLKSSKIVGHSKEELNEIASRARQRLDDERRLNGLPLTHRLEMDPQGDIEPCECGWKPPFVVSTPPARVCLYCPECGDEFYVEFGMPCPLPPIKID